MLPKQLKDIQRHQRQPKQVELFLQSDNSLPTLDPCLVPTHITTGPNLSQALPAPQPPTSQTICQSICNKHPSEALLQSQASERDISEAAESGVEWANDTPMNAYTALETTTSTINPLPDPGNFWLPSSYAEAMMHLDIWLGLIEKELSIDTPVVCIDTDAYNFSDLPLINITEIMSISLVTVKS